MLNARTLVRSVRFRITAMAAVAVAVVLVAAGVLLLRVQRDQLIDNLDRNLRGRADDLVTADPLSGDGPFPLVLAGTADDRVIQIVAADGAVLAGTADAIGEAAIVGPPVGDESFRTVAELPGDDDEYRVFSRRVPGDGGEVVIHVAASTDDVRELTGTLRSVVLGAVPVAVLVLVGVVWWLVGRTLRPVDLIRSEVASFSGTEAMRRVPEPGTGDEIDRLAATMNAMLERLESATSRQQQFVADASHELRSPLARLRAELDVALRGAGDDFDTLRRSATTEIDAMAALVDDLLVLARSDAGEMTIVPRPVDLDDVVFAEATGVRDRSDLDIDLHHVSAAHVVGDATQLRRVVRNLLDNAARHAASRIEVRLEEVEDAGVVRLSVADDGPGVPPGAADRVFDRFARLDDARAGDSGGTGLGLSIARDVVERHGGTIGVDAGHRPGARFVVELPAG